MPALSSSTVTGVALRLAFIGLIVAAMAPVVVHEARAGSPCPGDCNGDGVVSVDDLMALITIALGESTSSACPAGDLDGDGRVTVDEIVAALATALSGCPTPTRPSVTPTPADVATASPSVTPTPSTTPTPPSFSPSPTFTLVDCGAAAPRVESLSQPDEHRSVTLSGSVFVHGPRSVLRVCDGATCSRHTLRSAHPIIQSFEISHVVPDGQTELEICTINELCGDVACTSNDADGAPLVVAIGGTL